MRGTDKGEIEDPSVITGKYYLLGIGIDAYQNFTRLKNAKNDVEAIRRVLVERYHFETANTKLLTNEHATREEILEQLDRFRNKKILTDADRLLIYYAGHGLFDDERGFWIPVDGKKGRTSSFVSNAEVRDIIGNMAARHILLISDSCFSGSLLVRDATRRADNAFVDWDKKKSRFVFCSGKGVVADGKEGENSPFATQILRQLTENTSHHLNIIRLADEVTKAVSFNHAQQAECSPLFQVGHEGGQFVFYPKEIAPKQVENTPSEVDILRKELEELRKMVLQHPPQYKTPILPEPTVNVILEQSNGDNIRATKIIREHLKMTLEEAHNVVVKQLTLQKKPVLLCENVQKSQIAAMLKEFDEIKMKYRVEPYQKPIIEIPKPQFDFEPEMVFVKGGTFMMGSDKYNSEKPIHAVTLSNFYMGKYPVTQAQWQKIMGNNPSHFKGQDLPVESVSWFDCQEFCKKITEKTGRTFRLPTEAEWEYAARGGNQSEGFEYSGSNNVEEVAWYDENLDSTTHPVGKKKPNELGIYDLSGNVWEWCEDVWHAKYKGAPTDGTAWLKNGTENYHVLRGGAWCDEKDHARIANRYFLSSDSSGRDIGFRVITRHS
jgi:formylglycine-generating enzyme required for sulfatase activity/uncharacterized caspase-like protein